MKFVELPGNSVARIPYTARDVVMDGFFLQGNRTRLQRICDTALNDPTGGTYRYRVVADIVFVSAIYVDFMTSGHPLDKSRGGIGEIDIGFWMLVIGGKIDEPESWTLRWMPIYLFVDSGVALTGGREVYGFPKSYAQFERGPNPALPDVKVNAQFFPEFGADRRAIWGTLFEISTVPETSVVEQALENLGEGLMTIMPAVAESLPEGALPLPNLGMPMIFLKQFRDVSGGDAACFQAITEVQITPENIRDVSVLSDDPILKITHSASHPIARDLGIEEHARANMYFRIHMDFVCGLGTEIWRATSEE